MVIKRAILIFAATMVLSSCGKIDSSLQGNTVQNTTGSAADTDADSAASETEVSKADDLPDNFPEMLKEYTFHIEFQTKHLRDIPLMLLKYQMKYIALLLRKAYIIVENPIKQNTRKYDFFSIPLQSYSPDTLLSIEAVFGLPLSSGINL